MARSYTLHEIPPSRAASCAPSPCIYCGSVVRHENDGGHGWIGGTLLADGDVLFFMYHHVPCDAAEKAPPKDRVWSCRCGDGPGGDTHDNVGARCHNCGRPREHKNATDSSYYAMVWLERDLGDDFKEGVVEPEPGDTPADAAKRQIARELQTTCDDAGLPAGFFQVEAVLFGGCEPRLQKQIDQRLAERPHVWMLVWQSEDNTLLHNEAFASRDEAFRWASKQLVPIRGKAFAHDAADQDASEIERLLLERGPEAAVTRYAAMVGDKIAVQQRVIRGTIASEAHYG